MMCEVCLADQILKEGEIEIIGDKRKIKIQALSKGKSEWDLVKIRIIKKYYSSKSKKWKKKSKTFYVYDLAGFIGYVFMSRKSPQIEIQEKELRKIFN